MSMISSSSRPLSHTILSLTMFPPPSSSFLSLEGIQNEKKECQHGKKNILGYGAPTCLTAWVSHAGHWPYLGTGHGRVVCRCAKILSRPRHGGVLRHGQLVLSAEIFEIGPICPCLNPCSMTPVGMLWTGEKPEVKAMEETMTSYFNILQGFLLLSHGSTVGAGPTLFSSIHASVKQVVDFSFRLMKEFVSLYGSHGKDQQLSISQLVGAVWEACSALKKTPATNITAIGRGLTQVAVSMKDVLRELKELKSVSSDNLANETCGAETECEPREDNSSDGDLGNDLSPEEMKIAQLAIVVVSDTLSVIKELIRSITGLLKLEKPKDNSNFVDSLEKLLKLCQELGVQIDEIGAGLYPPQEIPVINAAMEKIHSIINDVQVEVVGLEGASDVFLEACNVLRSSLRQLALELGSSETTDLETKVENITLSN